MSKRAAEVQLTSESNLDDEGEGEEAGRFERATEDQIQGRVIKKARRQQQGGSTAAEEGGGGVFSALSRDVPPTLSRDATPPYLERLRSLNMSVCDWISRHVKENPFVDLSPIFRDYERHLQAIDTSASSSEESEEKENSDVAMTVRAKLFYKKEDGYCELGTGTLRVSRASSGGAHLVLRNDTALAKVLLNVRLTAEVPLAVKDNHLFFTCLPNPPLFTKGDHDKPVTYLVRVKTGDSANKLLSNIKQLC